MIITIGRQLAAGGREVGRMIADELNLRYFDKEILLESARRSGIADELFRHADENCNLFTLALSTRSQRLFEYQSEAIAELAQAGNCLFLGRAADYILRNRDDLFSVFLSADNDDRMSRLVCKEQISDNEAISLIEKTDKRRAEYYNFFTGKKWGDSRGYDLCINTTVMGIDGTVKLIIDAVKYKEIKKERCR